MMWQYLAISVFVNLFNSFFYVEFLGLCSKENDTCTTFMDAFVIRITRIAVSILQTNEKLEIEQYALEMSHDSFRTSRSSK